MPTLVIADDSPASSASSLLGDEWFEIVGCASTGLRTIDMVRELLPDVVLLDVPLPDVDATDAAVGVARRRCTRFSRVEPRCRQIKRGTARHAGQRISRQVDVGGTPLAASGAGFVSVCDPSGRFSYTVLGNKGRGAWPASKRLDKLVAAST